MAEGTIRSLVSGRGFGFIHPTLTAGTDTRQRDLFFHASQVMGIRFDELREGDTVSYVEEQDLRGRGPVATTIERTARVVMSGESEPVGQQWPLASGLAEDDDNTYDWDAAS